MQDLKRMCLVFVEGRSESSKTQSMCRHKFSKQFEIDAFERTLKEEKMVKEIIEDLGIRVALLY